MDSRAKSLLEKIAAFGDPEGQRGRALASVRSWSKEAAALLTAEPEPSNCPLYAATCSGHYDECPHADELRNEPSEDYEAWLRTQADGPWNTNKDDSGNYTDYSTALVFRGFLAAKQSAYRRIQEMQAEVERSHETIEVVAAQRNRAMEEVETLVEVIIEAARFLKAHQDKSEGELYTIGRLEQALAATEPKP